jgi:hypothetical protein
MYVMRLKLICLLVLLSGFVSAQNVLKTSGRFIQTPCGDTVLLRGVNKMFIWSDKTGEKTMAEIAKTNANCVRIVWAGTGKGRSGGERGAATELDEVIQRAVDNGMIPIPECHDATGSSWNLMSEIVDYWTRLDILAVLKKHEAYSIINIANEAGELVPDEDWLKEYKIAITRIRKAGLKLPLMIDGDQWGQSTEKLFKFGKELIEHDPEHNIVFSFHPWWPSSRFGSETAVVDRVYAEIEKSIELNLPLVIGEFAHHAPGCAEAIPHTDIMRIGAQKKIGWLAWSWGPGNSDCKEMDMTIDGTFATLRADSWANDVVNGPFGLNRTSQKSQYVKHQGECGPYCSKPSLTGKYLLEPSGLDLNADMPSGFEVSWELNERQVATGNKVQLTKAGEYMLVSDSAGCKKESRFTVLEEIPVYEFPSEVQLCDKATVLSIDPLVKNVEYEWLKDGKSYSKETSIELKEAGSYKLKVTLGKDQQESNEVKVSSPYLSVKDKTIPYAGEVFLKVKGGSGHYKWYYSERGGSPIHTGANFTTDVQKNTMFYIEDVDDPKCVRTPLKVTVK